MVTATTTIHRFNLPARIHRLGELAENLWWSWSPDATALFADLDPRRWVALEQNAVAMLERVGSDRLAELAANPGYLRRYDVVITKFDRMLTATTDQTWVGRHEPELADRTVAYFSAEFGIHPALPIYSGGLGVLAGDHTKTASDLGLPLIGVSLLYRQGYLRQRLTHDGWQLDVPGNLEHWTEPTNQVVHADGSPLLVEVRFEAGQPAVRLAIWRVVLGRVSIYLLDADVDGNPDWTRTISSRLYGGDQEHRIRQEIILGIGGVRALRAMGILPTYWHANEGHAGFHLLERARELVDSGESFELAADRVRSTTVFTSHTPVPAGHDVFPPSLMDRYFNHFWPQLGLNRDEFLNLGRSAESGDGFNMTALSLRLAGHRNAVSHRHGELTREMWATLWPTLEDHEVPITSVTNGVHLPTWISPAFQALLDQFVSSDWRERQDDEAMWERVAAIPDREFWRVLVANKENLINFLRARTRRRWTEGGFDPGQVVVSGPFLNPNVLTLGFARRFATYKRATLLFHDVDRLVSILTNPRRPVQILFAGKAHPADDGGKRLIQEIFWRAKDPRFQGRIAFVEDYDMLVASRLVAGVDVWLNNPKAPLEASGTSGMKAGANGVANLSILDGWWIEGWRPDAPNGWGIEPATDSSCQDTTEADAIYRLLEDEVAPLFYTRDDTGCPLAWIAMAKASMRTVAPNFSAQRMVIEYIRELYLPASRGALNVPVGRGQK
ncbi:MAG: alpha-glucan family phosphorylase [Chloroflexota bacterium]|nr:alpha-glucan family phosphorylase [Chloroflexota bacterium]